jgi:type IV pilus assembly protein PilE
MSLVELLTVVAIVGILGSVALSSYRGSMMRSNRTEGTSALLKIQVAQEKYYLNQNAYATTLAQLKMNTQTERGLYTLSLAGVTATGYTARATAMNGQAGDKECPVLSINASGQRLPSPATTKCWG